MLVAEEHDGVFVGSHGEGAKKRNVVGQHLVVGEVKFVEDDGVDVVVGEQEPHRRQIGDVILQDGRDGGPGAGRATL